MAAVYGIALELPDRTDPSSQLSDDSRQKIDRADYLIALVTHDAINYPSAVFAEIAYARLQGKPSILLLEHGTRLQFPPDLQVLPVEFDRNNPTAHERALLTAIRQFPQPRQIEVSWLAGIVLGLVGLGLLLPAKSSGK